MVPKTERFEMRLDEATLSRVDKWRSEQSDIPSRAEAIRRLVESGLAASSREGVKFSDGEKVLLLMMRDLYKHLRLADAEIDPEFIAKVIWGGHYWAAEWALPGVFHGHEDNPRDLRYVLDVLDMWEFIERSYERLSEADKATIAKDAAPVGKHVKFMGFDGNNESAQMGIARFLVDEMERFSRFAGRDLNSHMPTRALYERMLRLFEPMRTTLVGRDLTAGEIVALLRSRP